MEEHKCPKCGIDLQVCNSYYSNRKDWFPLIETETYYNHEMVCVNPNCSNFCGGDLGKPKTIVEVVSNRVNQEVILNLVNKCGGGICRRQSQQQSEQRSDPRDGAGARKASPSCKAQILARINHIPEVGKMVIRAEMLFFNTQNRAAKLIKENLAHK